MKDLDRIRALPSRTPGDLIALAEEVTAACLLPGVERPYTLHPEQALALVEADACGGVVANAAVGFGKSLLGFLLPWATDCERPVLVIPAHLRDKTLLELQEDYSQRWRVVAPVLKSYTEISRDKADDGVSRMLDDLSPDCIILDEAHHIGNLKAGCTKKILAYKARHPECKIFCMTGTLFQSSLMDLWHICAASLGESSPLPLRKTVCQAWSAAVDPGVDAAVRIERGRRLGLSELGAEDPRDGVRARMKSSPGFIFAASVYEGPLSFEAFRPDAPSACERHIEAAAQGVRPDGQPVDLFERLGIDAPQDAESEEGQDRTAIQRWALQQSLFLGYWDKPVKDPPPEWALARVRWWKFVAKVLERSGVYDTPEAVQIATERGKLIGVSSKAAAKGAAALAEWRRVRHLHRHETRPVWIDDRAPALQAAAEWMAHRPHGLVWVASPAPGRRICQLAGVPGAFFGEGQRAVYDDAGRLDRGRTHMIELHDGAAVVTLGANKSGRNLQAKWRDNLFLSVSSLAGTHEQAIGRTHRQGQQHPVSVALVQSTDSHRSALAAAIEKAEFIEQMTGDPPKILQARSLLEN